MITSIDMSDERWEAYRDAISILRSLHIITPEEYLEEICKIYH